MRENVLALNGGPPECRVKWPAWPVHGRAEERGLLSVLRSGRWWWGENVRSFERRFAAFQGARRAVTTTSGTTALEAAVAVHGIGRGDEVVVPAYTFVGTVNPVLRAGAKPIFADVAAGSLCIDPADVARKLTRRTRAVIPVHFAGCMADMDALRRICRPRGIAIIEDACHAWGSRWRGRGAGTLGACGAFSFQVTKNITAGEGGMLVTDDPGLAERLRGFTHPGSRAGRPWFEHHAAGSNLRMTEFSAAVLLAQLSRLRAQTMRRQANARILDRGLRDIPGIRPQATDPRHTRRAYHFYVFRIDRRMLGVEVGEFVRALSAEGVPCMTGWHPLYRNPLFGGGRAGAGYAFGGAPCPEAEAAFADTVWVNHRALLAPAAAMGRIVAAAGKVVRLRGSLVRSRRA